MRDVVAEPVRSQRRTGLARFVRDFVKRRNAVVGGTVLLIVVLVSLFPGLVAPYDPIRMNPAVALQPPSAEHLFGTDLFGRDVFSRVVHGGGRSLQLGVVAVVIAVLLGGTLGLAAGYYSGRTDAVIMRFVDILLAFPSILLALLVVYVLGAGTLNLMIAVGISAAPGYARIVRGSTLSIREQAFVEAARALGVRDVRLILRHVTPNILAPVIVMATLGLASAILVASALSFLGFGASPPSPEWGVMLNEGRQLLTRAWWLSTFPGVAIMVTVLGCNLLGDGIQDLSDPRMYR